MVRNEADIIEAAVRHNLASLDQLVVIDHGSFDGTTEILQQLAAEDARLEVAPDPSIEFQQSTRITWRARALLDEGADFVFALDADEFLKVPSRTKLETVLRQLPPEMHVLLHWQTYVPDDFVASPPLFSPNLATRRRKSEASSQLNKVVVARHFAERPREAVADGNHMVWDIDHRDQVPKHARIAPQVAAVAHVPVRSRRQFEKKIIIGYLSHVAAHRDAPHTAFHWREAYEQIRDGASFDHARLREIACNYGQPLSEWQPPHQIELVEDPIAFTSELRYQKPAEVGALQMLMRFCERVIEKSG
jgi:hypothetical protein